MCMGANLFSSTGRWRWSWFCLNRAHFSQQPRLGILALHCVSSRRILVLQTISVNRPGSAIAAQCRAGRRSDYSVICVDGFTLFHSRARIQYRPYYARWMLYCLGWQKRTEAAAGGKTNMNRVNTHGAFTGACTVDFGNHSSL